MAEEGKKGEGFSLPSTGLLALTLTVFGLILTGPSQLTDDRPAAQMESDSDRGRILDVDARMWQDPLGAVLKQKPGEHGAERSAGEHSPATTVDQAFRENGTVKNVLVLAAMIPGGPYPEEEERRRRERYAVLSALATHHFAPENTEHIGYFRADGLCEAGESDCSPKPFQVPFELFSNGAWGPGAATDGVVVLWLDQGNFDRNIQGRISRVLSQIHLQRMQLKYAVIGPHRSDQFKALMEMPRQATQGDGQAMRDINFYAAGATLDDKYIHPSRSATNVFRTIASDGDISVALAKELLLRHVDPQGDHVLLISEWDSLYGRLLPGTFARVYGGDQGRCLPLGLASQGVPAAHVYCINYMRGIDGILPSETEKGDTEQEARKQDSSIQSNNNIDRPSGNAQKDYLRRLVDQVRKLDQDIVDSEFPSPVKNNGIAAIGILGSDVYDKLMILEALRPYFPQKIFFTTDLDAAFLTPQKLRYTHNLIVGSSYGLTLAPELQMAIPPFRDSYQTATFLSSRLALARWRDGDQHDGAGTASRLSDILKEPRIFEIGRNGPVDLSPPHAGGGGNGDCGEDILACKYIHPGQGGTPGISRAFVLKIVALLFGVLLLHRLSWRSRGLFGRADGWVRDHVPGGVWEELAGMLPILAASLIIGGILYGFVATVGSDEPFYWMNGVSIWPSNLLQLSALILALWSLRKAGKMLQQASKQAQDSFLITAGGESADTPVYSVHKWNVEAREGKIDVQYLWRDYHAYGTHRWKRAWINTLVFLPFGFVAVMLSGGLPIPARGNAFYSDALLEIGCVVALVYLIMWIVDVIRVASKLVEQIARKEQTAWPECRGNTWGWSLAKESDVACWVDVQFVAQYTKAMEKLIWFPVPPMLLVGLARSSLFDNWTFSAGLFAAIAILLCYLFSTAFLLQHGARKMRDKALDKLEESLMALRGSATADDKHVAQLQRMIVEIKANEEGAFTPFMRQPMVQALLATLSGSGGIAMLLERPFN